MTAHRGRNGRRITWNAGDEGGARQIVPIELRNPAIGKSIGCLRVVPAEPFDHPLRRQDYVVLFQSPAERCEEVTREEVTVSVVQHLLSRSTSWFVVAFRHE